MSSSSKYTLDDIKRWEKDVQRYEAEMSALDQKMKRTNRKLMEAMKAKFSPEEIARMNAQRHQQALPRIKEAKNSLDEMYREISDKYHKTSSSSGEYRFLKAHREMLGAQIKVLELEMKADPTTDPTKMLTARKDSLQAQLKMVDLELATLQSKRKSFSR